MQSLLLQQLGHHAARAPDQLAFVFLDDREQETSRLTFGQLDALTAAAARALARFDVRGRRVLLPCEDAARFIPLFLGCLRAGAVAVPVKAPNAHRGLDTLSGICRNAQPRLVVASMSARSVLEPQIGQGAQWALPDELLAGASASDITEAGTPTDIAFIQYSSGSTGNPKGVLVAHRHLASNTAAIAHAFGIQPGDVVGGWLPLHHDMGLIGLVLTPVHLGITSVLMPPMAFLTRPARWLRMIDRYGISFSGGPNFAFDHCVDRIGAEEKAGLDLRRWNVAFNGAEPVQARTLRRFAAAFGESGLRRDALFPCYGLAESTLFVSGCRWHGEDDVTVGTGSPPHGAVIRVVDPVSKEPCGDGVHGEIWVAGPSVAAGYVGEGPAASDAFRATLAPSDCDGRHYLRTGDAGVSRNGLLHVTGRIKDVIIVRGRKIHPEDVEAACAEVCATLQLGLMAAFPVTIDGAEALGLLVEAPRAATGELLARASMRLREVVLARAGLSVGTLAFVPTGTIPRTSSGKARRHLCKDLFLSNQIAPLPVGAPYMPSEVKHDPVPALQ